MILSDTLVFLTKQFKYYLKRAKYRAKKKGFKFNIDFCFIRDLYFKQKARCFYTGKNFNFKEELKKLSLDRIDSSKGYTKGNVVWCLKGINFLKYSFDYKTIKEMCVNIIKYSPDWKLLNELCRI